MFKAIAVAMTVGSLVASAVSITSQEADAENEGRAVMEMSLVVEDTILSKLRGVESEIKVNEDRLAAAKGIADDNRNRLSVLRVERDNILQAYEEAKIKRIEASIGTGESNGPANPLSALAVTIGVAPEKFRLYYTAFLTLLLELGGLATSAAAVSVPRLVRQTARRYRRVGDKSHVILENGRSLCGGSYRGADESSPSGELCQACLLKVLSEAKE